MLAFLWTLPVQLRGTQNKQKFQKKKIFFTIELEPSQAGYPTYKSTVFTTRPNSIVMDEQIMPM